VTIIACRSLTALPSTYHRVRPLEHALSLVFVEEAAAHKEPEHGAAER
jgi:hypothetical protein